MGNILGILGRPNVGKSTFFNRLVGTRDAIVDPTSGVTRDRHYGKSDWNGKEFSVIDTGGYVLGSDDVFEEEIRKQAILAIEESDVILFMVDAIDGLTDMDKDVANLLRRGKKKVFVAANKCDTPSKLVESAEFYQLGLGEIYPVSAQSGTGTGELLDAIALELLEDDLENNEGLPRVAFVGRPNVGKSSIINSLIGVDRNIVTPVAGTTRDSVFTRYNSFGFDFMLVDTAGLRRKTKVSENIEFYSVMRSIRTIENSDICVLMIDAEEGFESQDMNIFRLIQRNSKGVVVVVNKWDLIEKDSNTHVEYERVLKEKLAPFTDIQVVFTSVTNKQRIFKVMDAIKQVNENINRKVATSKLNDAMLPLIENYPPPMGSRSRKVRIKFVTQLPTKIPTFAFFCNLPNDIKDGYARFLENKLRENYELTGVPIRVYFRQK